MKRTRQKHNAAFKAKVALDDRLCRRVALSTPVYQVRRLWHQALARRSQRGMTWEQFNRMLQVSPASDADNPSHRGCH